VKGNTKLKLPKGCSELPQLMVRAKSSLLVPAIAMLLIDKDALPEFARVTARAGLVVATVWLPWLPKISEVGERLPAGEPPPGEVTLGAGLEGCGDHVGPRTRGECHRRGGVRLQG